jgi:ATP-dependent Lon protease
MKFFRKPEETQHEALIEELRQRIPEATMPPKVEKIAVQEIEALSRTNPSSVEYSIGFAYVDYLLSMPWNRKTEDNLDLLQAEQILNEGHYGLQKTKERILEHLAVRTLKLNRRPRVLVVDDEDAGRKNLSHVLEREDYDVDTASGGDEALRKLESSGFDVVVTDLKMAGTDGMAILERVKTRHPDTGVIMITGYATVQSAIEAMKKGAFTYIAKPFKLDDVRSAVRQAIEKKSGVRGSAGSVLCFAGPPGTGKTSLGMSIATALGRKFVRISLAGMKDEADIRGHRRTYAGALPGRIIEEIHRVEFRNPIIMMDELDKIGQEFKGDPSAALLEVLDPEQNRSFVDHYLDVPFDLSDAIFILTANVIENIPAPLRDRMEVIEFSGYTREEKVCIASRFIVPRQMREKGLYVHPPVFTSEALAKIIDDYTCEAGTRGLERKIAAICRKIARGLVDSRGDAGQVTITPDRVEQFLGLRKFRYDEVEEGGRIGVTTGLVRTEAGGNIIFVEAAEMKGKKELIMTGSLGEVMRESALAALSYIRSNAGSFGIADDFFEHRDIHIHVPSGATQKDGPSAGITIAAALISLLTRRPARRDIAMSGEITLTGRVLAVGGIREKILAARRARVASVILPAGNRAEVEELPKEVKSNIKIELVDSIGGAVERVLLRQGEYP